MRCCRGAIEAGLLDAKHAANGMVCSPMRAFRTLQPPCLFWQTTDHD